MNFKEWLLSISPVLKLVSFFIFNGIMSKHLLSAPLNRTGVAVTKAICIP
jgi:hypothetical protein